MQARARARARARSLGDRARSLDCRPLRIRIALALPASAGMTSRKAAVLVLAIGADDPAVIETARAYETAMKERGGAVEAKHFSTGGTSFLSNRRRSPKPSARPLTSFAST